MWRCRREDRFWGQHGVLVSFWPPYCEIQQPHTPLTWKRWRHSSGYNSDCLSSCKICRKTWHNESVCITSHLSSRLISLNNNPNGSREPLMILYFQGLGWVITAGTAGRGSDARTSIETTEIQPLLLLTIPSVELGVVSGITGRGLRGALKGWLG